MDEIDIAAGNIRSLEMALKAAEVSLWDRFFLAALPSAMLLADKAERKERHVVDPITAAAFIADEAMLVRNAHEAAEYSKPVDVADALRYERGVVSVLSGLLCQALEVVETIVPENEDERLELAELITRCQDAVVGVRRAQVLRETKGGV